MVTDKTYNRARNGWLILLKVQSQLLHIRHHSHHPWDATAS